VALSVIALAVTWGLLAAISIFGSGRRRSSAAATAATAVPSPPAQAVA